MIKDSYEIMEAGELVVCPECGGYSDQEYTFFGTEEESVPEGVSVCALCGRFFS